jgi:hypothetical protein
MAMVLATARGAGASEGGAEGGGKSSAATQLERRGGVASGDRGGAHGGGGDGGEGRNMARMVPLLPVGIRGPLAGSGLGGEGRVPSLSATWRCCPRRRSYPRRFHSALTASHAFSSSSLVISAAIASRANARGAPTPSGNMPSAFCSRRSTGTCGHAANSVLSSGARCWANRWQQGVKGGFGTLVIASPSRRRAAPPVRLSVSPPKATSADASATAPGWVPSGSRCSECPPALGSTPIPNTSAAAISSSIKRKPVFVRL